MLDRSAIGQLSSLSSRTKWQRLPAGDIRYVVYRLTAVAAILFYWITMKVVQQLTCLTLGRPNDSTGELLNTPLVSRLLDDW